MFVRRFTFTICTLVAFIFALSYEGLFHGQMISRETPNTPLLHAGASSDGAVALSVMPLAPTVSVNKKVPNHARTLRVFFAENIHGDTGLYVESARPHEYYLVSGGFLVTQAYNTVSWLNNSTIQFYARVEDGFLVRASFDLNTMSAIFEPVDEPVFPTEEGTDTLDIF